MDASDPVLASLLGAAKMAGADGESLAAWILQAESQGGLFTSSLGLMRIAAGDGHRALEGPEPGEAAGPLHVLMALHSQWQHFCCNYLRNKSKNQTKTPHVQGAPPSPSSVSPP